MFELKDRNELYHHGVKGQKWGVRRYQKKDGTLNAYGKWRYGTKKNMLADQKVKAERKKDVRNRRTLSDAELKKRVERLKLENEYKSLSNEKATKGKAFAKDFLGTPAKKVAAAAITGGMAYIAKLAITNKGDKKAMIADFKENVLTNPGKMEELSKWIVPNPNAKKK